MSSIKTTLTTLMTTALVFFLLDAANRALFSSAAGEAWIYLPAGLQMAFVLVFLGTGALGIALASCAIAMIYFPDMDAVTLLGTGLIAGFSPWLARLICLSKFKLDVQLHQLNRATLVKTAVTFAALHAVMQQMWFALRLPSTHFLEATVMVFFANLLGTIVLLYVAKYSIGLLPAPSHPK